ncbi:zinc-dependent metalloprotease family protein [Sinorhizobium medicae]|uniref:zinc-dependent metalloprotease family protein n=1 Tax=Sinorhizobium medicae TaxID=110321 RepID=UPI000FD763EA|nr:zinc-dependent metalloprotease family protein [Sinorhizobium medicae]RVJ12585.1 hypothetical protein CN181_02975 [Sinorhizobium medicae]
MSHVTLFTFLVIAGLLTVSPALGQQLVEPIPANLDLSKAQQEQINRLNTMPSAERVTVVRVHSDRLKNSNQIAISLSNDSVISLAKTNSTSVANNTFIWSGETPSSLAIGAGNSGEATISVTGSNISASIRTSDSIYRIQPLPGGLHALIKIRTSAFPPEHPQGNSQPRFEQRDINPTSLRQPDDTRVATVSILVLFTPSAAQFTGDVVDFANIAIAVSNQSLSNSGIRARFELADAKEISYQEDGSHETDLNRLADPADGYMDEAHSSRDEVSADLVVLINNDDSYCGIAKQIFADAQSAFATVYFSCAVDNLSFAHEIGHLLGACHNDEESPDCVPFQYGHGYIIPAEGVRTIMAYQCPTTNCIRQPQWSRPPEWGTYEFHFDAKVLDETTPRASAFR